MVPATSDREAALLDRYRRLPPGQRRSVAAQAKPSLVHKLYRVEQQLAMDRSPGAMAAVLTDRREMQARHLNLVDTAWIDMAEGRRDRVPPEAPPPARHPRLVLRRPGRRTRGIDSRRHQHLG
ncbi:hypothetical protein [Streptomyces sp. NPDC001787]|uniref:hypothetical protein n=1 Tax=Streptomyces sp. NPDC001787 TaxID=3154523 RepID=UPI003324F984